MEPGSAPAAVDPKQASGAARAAFATSITIAAALAVWHATRLAAATHGLAWAEVVIGGVAGLLAADFVTGLIHWACDTWGHEKSRWPGASLIRSFRDHHRRPTSMLEHDWIEVNGEAAAAALVPLAVMALPGAAPLLEHPGWFAFAWAAIGASALSNQIHQWAHRHDPPAIVRQLQRAGLILSRRRHARHHRAACVERYCITTGWLNPALDAIAFWRRFERAVTRATGAVPRAADAPAYVAHEIEATRLPSRTFEGET